MMRGVEEGMSGARVTSLTVLEGVARGPKMESGVVEAGWKSDGL
jgi:hypothetical protein